MCDIPSLLYKLRLGKIIVVCSCFVFNVRVPSDNPFTVIISGFELLVISSMPGRGAIERHWLQLQAKLAPKDAANGRASSHTMCAVKATSPANQQHCSQHYQTGKQPPPPPVVPHDVSAVIRESKAEAAAARLQIKEYAQKLEILQQQSEEALKIKAKDIQQEAELETATALQTLRTQAE